MAVRSEAAVKVKYVPVDTIGCVEIIDAHWPVDSVTNEVTSCSASYRLLRPYRISRSGAEDLVRTICRHLVAGRSLLDGENGDIPTARTAQEHENAMPDGGFFRSIALWLYKEQSARRSAARARTEEPQQAARQIAALDNALTEIARSRSGPRC